MTASAARVIHGVGAHGPRGHTPPRRRDEPQALGRSRPATMTASAARVTHDVHAQCHGGHTPPRRHDKQQSVGRKRVSKISASAARLAHAVAAHGPRGHTPPRRRDEPQALGRSRPATMTASAARVIHGVGAHGPRGHTPPRRRGEPQSLWRSRPAKMATPPPPTLFRAGGTMRKQRVHVRTVCQAPRLQRHPPRPHPHRRSARPPQISHPVRLAPVTASIQPAAAPAQRRQTAMSRTPPSHGRAHAAAPWQRPRLGEGGSGGVAQQLAAAAMLRTVERNVPATGASEGEGGGARMSRSHWKVVGGRL
jgi:hypothetical protein